MASPANERKRAFVTGLSGFTGCYLRARLLEAGCEVMGISQAASPELGTVQCDLSDQSALTDILRGFQPHYVVHLAAIAYVAHDSPLEFYRVNVLGSETLLRAIEEANLAPEKVLIASSANVYGNAVSLPIDENAIPAPTNHYANSKLAMEMITRNWFDRLPIVITRPFNYTGFGQAENFLVPKIVKHFAQGAETIRLGNLDVSRDISDVSFLVEAYYRLLQTPARSVVVNVCGGKCHSIADILQTMEKLSGRALRVEVDPQLVRGAEVVRLFGDRSRLNTLIGDLPSPELTDTLETMYRKYQAQYRQ
nr:GDP-mannose 4,6-dehydratase [uncultured Ralstonia sp.]